jgi:mevalonate kinase
MAETSDFQYHSNGKLLLTGEYLILNGCKSIALPLKKGQSMNIRFSPGNELKINWSATDPNGIWFEAELFKKDDWVIRSTSNPLIAARLTTLLETATTVNPAFLSETGTYRVDNHLAFKKEWGWGSSSTLIANLARWSETDPYQLNRLVSNGSGYDIACARSESPLIYQLINNTPVVEEIRFAPGFRDLLAFVYLGNKMDTSMEISQFNRLSQPLEADQTRIGEIGLEMATTTSFDRFNQLIENHESILSQILHKKPVKELLFPDFPGFVKSLGAWGGDFILASSLEDFRKTKAYFLKKGYPTLFSWNDIIK